MSVIWNQLFSPSFNLSGGNCSKSYDSYTNTYTATSSTSYTYLSLYNYSDISFIAGNIYIATATFGGTCPDVYYVMGGVTTSHGSTSSGIFTRRVEATATNTRFIIYGSKPTGESVTLTVKDMMIFDLTTMFGAGNEPTLAEFEAMFPLNRYYQYDPGQTMELPTNVMGDPLVLLNRRMMMPFNIEPYIVFADPVVEQICATTWGDGIGLKKSKAAKVTNIGTNVFQSNTSIISFEELKYFTGLTTISNTVFKNCSNLTTIGVPTNVTQFGMQGVPITEIDITDLSAYLNVAALNNGNYCLTTGSPSTGAHLYLNGTEVTSVTYPSGTTSIPKYKWYRHAYITSITLPSSLTSIGDCAFYGCSSLTAIEIPSGVTVLRPSTFRECSSLATLTLNGPVSVVNGYVFQSCSSLKRVNVPSAADWMDCVWMNTNYCWPGGGSNELHIYPINSNTEITSFTIPNTKTTIESCAFRDCINVTSVTIPSSITSIKSWAFAHSGLSGTIVIPATVTTLEWDVFRQCPNITNLCIYNNSISNDVITTSQNITTGNGTGVLYTKNFTSNRRENYFKFKHIIIDGNFEYTQTDFWLRGSNCEALRIYGNCTMNHASRATQLTYDDNWKLIEILGQFIDANSQGASICRSNRVPSGAIVHLGYNGVAATPAQVNASQANLSKVYVGDGSSQAADQAVLALYQADANWSADATALSKLDIWYNYNGAYKTPPTIPT